MRQHRRQQSPIIKRGIFALTVAILVVHSDTFSTRPTSYLQATKSKYSNTPTRPFENDNFFREAMTSELQMSSLEQDPEESGIKFKEFLSKMRKIKLELPPPPEDQISMVGDIASIFLYSFLDHFMTYLYDDFLNSPSAVNTISAPAALEYFAAATSEISGTPTSSALPVWFDTVSSAPFGIIPLTTSLPLHHHVSYAPIISSAGMASVVLCSTWLACGYMTGAFRFSNTLGSTQRALAVTAVTWFATVMVVTALAYGSDVLVGNMDQLHYTVGLTKADVDFIFDSLSVLLVWRFLWSSIFGSGED